MGGETPAPFPAPGGETPFQAPETPFGAPSAPGAPGALGFVSPFGGAPAGGFGAAPKAWAVAQGEAPQARHRTLDFEATRLIPKPQTPTSKQKLTWDPKKYRTLDTES